VRYIDVEKLEAIDPKTFESSKPYPFANPADLLTPEGFDRLCGEMPDLELFEKEVGVERPANQKPHDRYSLEYRPGLPVPRPWREFIEELRGDRYRLHIAKLMGGRKVVFRFHWHYTPAGCWVSPHADAVREHGSHLFYFNDPSEWDPSWGGETLILDDGGRLDYLSAPEIEDFDGEIACSGIGNYSAIIRRTDHAWHAMRPLTCPEGRFRRVFIVIVNPNNLFWKVRDRVLNKVKQSF
jgi:hypothetical protein